MQFTLHYQGALPPNGPPEAKQRVREQLHPQLKDLWRHPRLSRAGAKVLDRDRLCSLDDNVHSNLRLVGGHEFACLATRKLNVSVQLRVDFLRPESPGRILKSGDIDNRIKTLFDGLSIPPQPNMVPKDFTPAGDQKPLFCLLEDDSLVTAVQVQTYQWLAGDQRDPNDVLLIIHVLTALTGPMTGLNEGLA